MEKRCLRLDAEHAYSLDYRCGAMHTVQAYQEGEARQDPMDTGAEAAAMGSGRNDPSGDPGSAELRQPPTFRQLLWRLQVQALPLLLVVLGVTSFRMDAGPFWLAVNETAAQRSAAALIYLVYHCGCFPILESH